ncbi:hypothetical protein [Clostridium thailandense]|uniref:hypothetical protein n=1 Tax=Clostridium thailandense TaxID=2794346 RepID=UPI003989F14A
MNQLSNKHEKSLDLYLKTATSIMLIIGITFIAANLRTPLTAVGPLVEQIRGSLHISNTLAGMITTLPLFAFAGFSPFAPRLARKFGTELVLLWALTFCLSIIFFSFRTRNADEAARLSGMAQSVGYLLAAFGPMLFGILHDVSNNWALPLIILIGIAGLCLFAGLGASRDLYVSIAVDNESTHEFYTSNKD